MCVVSVYCVRSVDVGVLIIIHCVVEWINIICAA